MSRASCTTISPYDTSRVFALTYQAHNETVLVVGRIVSVEEAIGEITTTVETIDGRRGIEIHTDGEPRIKVYSCAPSPHDGIVPATTHPLTSLVVVRGEMIAEWTRFAAGNLSIGLARQATEACNHPIPFVAVDGRTLCGLVVSAADTYLVRRPRAA